MPTQAHNTTPLVSPEILLQRAREMVPVLASRARKTEELRRVPDETVAEMQAAGFFRVLQAKQYGGYEMDPQVFYDICMTLAEGCMSTAWIYGVIGVHNWQLACFDPRASEDVWGKDTSVLVASTYMPKGQVKPVEGGFQFSGRWGFSSGIDHAQWVLLGGLIFPADGKGPPEYRTFLLPRKDFEVIDTWHVMGLKGTGSKDIVVKDVFVPEYRTHKATDGFMGTNPAGTPSPPTCTSCPSARSSSAPCPRPRSAACRARSTPSSILPRSASATWATRLRSRRRRSSRPPKRHRPSTR